MATACLDGGAATCIVTWQCICSIAPQPPRGMGLSELSPRENTATQTPLQTQPQPFIPAGTVMRELTPVPLLLGTLLGIIFGASSLYLVLKVGLTVSASIPVAVISLTVFRLIAKFGGRDATILEHNIVQTAGSAGESIAFGVGVTMPAILILGSLGLYCKWCHRRDRHRFHVGHPNRHKRTYRRRYDNLRSVRRRGLRRPSVAPSVRCDHRWLILAGARNAAWGA